MRGLRTNPPARPTQAALAVCVGLVTGLSLLSYKLTKRYGQALLQLEALEERQPAVEPATPAATTAEPPELTELQQQQLLFEQGMPAGSVGMNFELPAFGGGQVTLTSLRGSRVLLIFISTECIPSISMLPGLARLSAKPSPDRPIPVIIASGDVEQLRVLVDENNITTPVLIQTTNEVSRLYFVSQTPVAYLLDEEGITMLARVEGPQSILGVLAAAGLGVPVPLGDGTTPEPAYALNQNMPRIGNPLPSIDLPLLGGGRLTNDDLFGQETLLVFFDPLCEPCLDLLPDLARIHTNPALPDVILITRRDGELTRNLQATADMPYPIARQDHWDLSRRFGVLAVPAAWLVYRDGCLAANPAVGQQAVRQMIASIPAADGSHRMVSLASLLEHVPDDFAYQPSHAGKSNE